MRVDVPARKEFYKKFLGEGLLIELHLPTHLLHDYFLAEIAVKTIENKQDVMVIFIHFSLAQRMRRIFQRGHTSITG